MWLQMAAVAVDAIGSSQAIASTVEGAQAQADIETLSREYEQRRFERDMEYQQPYIEAGERAIEPFSEAIKGEFDVTQSALYQMQDEMIQGELADAPDYIKEDATAKLGATEGEMAKGRLMDLQLIGLGSASSAGQTAIDFGSALAESTITGGTALAEGAMSSAMQTQNMWTDVAEDVSGMPSYFATKEDK